MVGIVARLPVSGNTSTIPVSSTSRTTIPTAWPNRAEQVGVQSGPRPADQRAPGSNQGLGQRVGHVQVGQGRTIWSVLRATS
jgi:hypothetical protein